MNITKIANINFQSNEYREYQNAAMKRIQEARKKAEEERIKAKEERIKAEEERKKQAELARLKAEADLIERINQYPPLDDQISTSVACFLSQFTCSILNASKHNLKEFVGDEKTAADLRKGLSPECQAESIRLRKMIQDLEEVKDPVKTLIVANRMQKFVPKEGILTDEQHQTFVEGVKGVLSTTIRNADLGKFEPEDKASILEMVQKIEESDSVHFGIEAQLKKLVDKLNKRNLNLGFIAPVPVKDFSKDVAKAMLLIQMLK